MNRSISSTINYNEKPLDDPLNINTIIVSHLSKNLISIMFHYSYTTIVIYCHVFKYCQDCFLNVRVGALKDLRNIYLTITEYIAIDG